MDTRRGVGDADGFNPEISTYLELDLRIEVNLTNDKLKCKVSITWTSNIWLYLSISYKTGITWLSQIR